MSGRRDRSPCSGRWAEAGRERRAKVINAAAALQAAAKLAEAAEMLMRYPVAVQIRYVQTLREIASERNTTPFVSIPMNLLEPILNAITTNSAS